MKPFRPARSIARRQREFRVLANPGVKPRSGIAEALADVIAPVAIARRARVRREPHLTGFSRPSKLATSALLPFPAQEIFVGSPRLVAEANPGKVEELVRKNAGQLIRISRKFEIQHDSAFADEAARENRLAARPVRIQLAATRAQCRQEANANGAAFQSRQPLAERLNAPSGAAGAA